MTKELTVIGQPSMQVAIEADLAELTQSAARYASQSKAPNTLHAYEILPIRKPLHSISLTRPTWAGRWPQASPITYVKQRAPPVLLIQGDRDE